MLNFIQQCFPISIFRFANNGRKHSLHFAKKHLFHLQKNCVRCCLTTTEDIIKLETFSLAEHLLHKNMENTSYQNWFDLDNSVI